jgi:hypothetical protein
MIAEAVLSVTVQRWLQRLAERRGDRGRDVAAQLRGPAPEAAAAPPAPRPGG